MTAKVVYKEPDITSSSSDTEESFAVKTRQSELKGLCTTCIHALTCIYPDELGRAVTFCNEFEGMEKPVGFSKKKAEDEGYERNVKLPEIKKRKFVGLCVNCTRRFTCEYPKPESGVWHCEEYE